MNPHIPNSHSRPTNVSGYTGNGHYCSDVNECDNNNGGCSTSPSVDCINTRVSASKLTVVLKFIVPSTFSCRVPSVADPVRLGGRETVDIVYELCHQFRPGPALWVELVRDKTSVIL